MRHRNDVTSTLAGEVPDVLASASAAAGAVVVASLLRRFAIFSR